MREADLQALGDPAECEPLAQVERAFIINDSSLPF
jgi:hypothetical protein